MSRHHHITVLATAWWLTQDERYAQAAAAQLRSWWSANPLLSGVHWTSGIEAGIRLISWTWTRRLLDDWPKVGDLFEHNDDAVRQIGWHQEFLAAFPSRGSSANNHVVAEAAGRLVAACAFPWYDRSPEWRASAAELLERELAANTFADGLNRELATDYHRFVLELGLVAAVEADAHGTPLSEATWTRLAQMLDAAAAMVDVTGRPPRQGDGDEGPRGGRPGARSWATSCPPASPCWARPAGGLRSRADPRRSCARPSGEERRLPRPRATRPVPHRPGSAALAGGWSGDLVPVRWWAARLPVHRGARPCGRPVGGGAARRRRHPRRPGQLLLPRRTGLASGSGRRGPQHHRDRRGEPVRVRRTLPLEQPGQDNHPVHRGR